MKAPKFDAVLLAALGNSGKLRHTRHSVAMQLLDLILERNHIVWQATTHYGQLAEMKTATLLPITEYSQDPLLEFFKHICMIQSIYFFSPTTPMNLNGKSVESIMKHLKIPTENLLVLHDDCERAIGKLSLKLKGSANGHHGVESVMNALKSSEFARLRIGIGRPQSDDLADYVLSPFTKEEKAILQHRSFPTVISSIEKNFMKRLPVSTIVL